VPALSDAERRALAELKPGCPTLCSTKASGDWGGSSAYTAALGLVTKGLARELKGGRFEPIACDAAKAAEPDGIWLPKANANPPMTVPSGGVSSCARNSAQMAVLVSTFPNQNGCAGEPLTAPWRISTELKQSWMRIPPFCSIG
jgi:hypothetical protein